MVVEKVVVVMVEMVPAHVFDNGCGLGRLADGQPLTGAAKPAVRLAIPMPPAATAAIRTARIAISSKFLLSAGPTRDRLTLGIACPRSEVWPMCRMSSADSSPQVATTNAIVATVLRRSRMAAGQVVHRRFIASTAPLGRPAPRGFFITAEPDRVGTSLVGRSLRQ